MTLKPGVRVQALLDSGLSPSATLVAICLSQRLNRFGCCWVSIGYIADHTRLSKRTVNRVLSEGEADGWLTRSGVHRSASTFRLIFENLPKRENVGRIDVFAES